MPVTNDDLRVLIAGLQKDVEHILNRIDDDKEGQKIRTEALADLRMDVNKLTEEKKFQQGYVQGSWKTMVVGTGVIGGTLTFVYVVGGIVLSLTKALLHLPAASP